MSNEVKVLILDVSDALEFFLLRVAAMSVAEVDINEVLSNIVNSLCDKNRIEYNYNNDINKYLCWGSINSKSTDDGLLLVEGYKVLFNAVSKRFEEINAWDKNGFSRWRFLRSLPDESVVVERH